MRSALDGLESRCQIGIDEAGRGPLLGPVCAAAVLLPENPELFKDVKDSKKYSSSAKLATAAKLIMHHSVAYGVGWATAPEVDKFNIRVATHLAMHRAIRQLLDKIPSANNTPHLLVDGNEFTLRH